MQKHDATLQGAFEGYRNSAEKFKSKVLQELTSNTASFQTQADLVKKAESIFGPTPTNEAAVAAVDTAKLIAHETNALLKKRVIGKEDVDIAAMIKKLGNSDWAYIPHFSKPISLELFLRKSDGMSVHRVWHAE